MQLKSLSAAFLPRTLSGGTGTDIGAAGAGAGAGANTGCGYEGGGGGGAITSGVAAIGTGAAVPSFSFAFFPGGRPRFFLAWSAAGSTTGGAGGGGAGGKTSPMRRRREPSSSEGHFTSASWIATTIAGAVSCRKSVIMRESSQTASWGTVEGSKPSLGTATDVGIGEGARGRGAVS